MQNSVESMTQFTIDAARLLVEFEPRRNQLKSYSVAHNGSFQLYAADSNIVKLFTNPAEMGPVNKYGPGYGTIFRSDDARAATGFASVLSDFIFSKLSDFPIVQFDSHADETMRVFDAVCRTAGRSPKRNVALEDWFGAERAATLRDISSDKEDVILDLARNLSELPGRKEGSAETIAELAINLIIAKPRHAQREMFRFLQLFTRSDVIPISTFCHASQKANHPTWFVDALRPPDGEDEESWISNRTNDWIKVIGAPMVRGQKGVKARRRLARRVKADAGALANLEYHNKKLRPYGGQMILITGDQTLAELVRVENPDLYRESLVHPRAFLIEALGGLVSEASPQRTFRHSLELLLNRFAGRDEKDIEPLRRLTEENEKDREDLERRIRSPMADSEPLYANVFRQWEYYKEEVTRKQPSVLDASQELISSLVRNVSILKATDIEQSLKDLEALFDQSLEDEVDALFLTFSSAGIGTLYAIRDDDVAGRWRSRNPPTVVFERFPATRSFVSQLQTADERESLSNLLNDLSSDIPEERDQKVEELKYLKCLSFSILSAAQGNWYASRVLAERALVYAHRLEHRDLVDGREAYYVLSQTTRLTARDFDELNQAKGYLAASKDLFDFNSKSGEAETLSDADCIKLFRYRAEDISIALTEAHFNVWKPDSESTDFSLSDIEEGILSLSSSLLSFSAKDDTTKEIHTIIGTYLFINAVQVLHLTQVLNKTESARILNCTSRLWERFGVFAKSLTQGNFHVTYLMAVYIAFYRMTVLNERPDKDLLENLVSKENLAKHSLMPYDEERFRSVFNALG